MFSYLPSKFKFALFVNNNETDKLVCYADSYEIKEDGSIIFYKTVKSEDKKFKIPVLAYPQGKWEYCILIDENEEYPIFNNKHKKSNIDTLENVNDKNGSHNMTHKSDVIENNFIKNNDSLNQIDDSKSYLEKFIKNYINDLEEENFVLDKFLVKLKEKNQNSYDEEEIIWEISKMIRNKTIMSSIFYDNHMQKTLSLILPDIMKRQWEGKISPILEILQDKEETKNVTVIDLSVWMVKNNY